MMKRFGIQLAASGIVILLGALGVAQAQRDSRAKESTEWDQQAAPALTPPPAPIAAWTPADGDNAADGPGMQSFGSFGLSSSNTEPKAVRTVAHEEPAQPAISLPSWSMPVDSPSTDESAASPTMPVEAGPTSMAMPSYDPAMAPAAMPSDTLPVEQAEDAPANAYQAMPTLQFADSPSNGLRDSAPAPDSYPASNQPPSMMPAQLSVPTQPSFPLAELQTIETAESLPTTMPPRLEPAARIASLPRTGLPNLAPQPLDTHIDETVLAEPGDRRLDGIQSPSVVIHKRAPEEVKVGKPASFVIHVQNVGGVEALDVRVHDRVPMGMRLVDASPAPQVQGDLLTWELGALEPSGERTVTMQLIPEQEGELGSVARVTFEAAASVRTMSTRPMLKITQRTVEQVLIGQQVEIELEVSNPGSGTATGVVLQEDVPEGLEHPKGRQLDNVIGTLAPGEVRRQVLKMRAVAPGPVQNRIRLTGDDGLMAEDAVNLEVIAPELAIELEGPSRRFLERQATFNVNLANIGTAGATNVEVVAYLDRGFSFVGTEYQGQYDPNRHAVYWSLAELPVDGRGSVPLKLLPIEEGERAIRLEAKGDLNVIAQSEKTVSVDTLAELTFSITDDADPIEVGSEATYEIRISNRGSRDDSNVQMQMLLPPGLQLVASEAEARTDDRGLIAFAPTLSLPAGGDTVHRVRVRGVAAGTHVVKAIVTSAQATTPVTKEESTMVYSDK